MEEPTCDAAASAARSARRLGRRGEELSRLTPRGVGEGRARQESGDRLDAPLLVEIRHHRPRSPAGDFLPHGEVTVPRGRDLRQVRHDENLLVRSQGPELASDGLGRRTGDPGVHLVEDERPHGASAAAAAPALARRLGLRERGRHGELDA